MWDATISRTDHNITVHIRLRGGQDHTLTLALPLASWQLRKIPDHVVVAINELTDSKTTALPIRASSYVERRRTVRDQPVTTQISPA